MSGETQEQFVSHALIAATKNFYWLMMTSFIIMIHRQESDILKKFRRENGKAPHELSRKPKRSI